MSTNPLQNVNPTPQTQVFARDETYSCDCLDSMTWKITHLPCKHSFCSKHIEDYLCRNGKCPHCSRACAVGEIFPNHFNDASTSTQVEDCGICHDPLGDTTGRAIQTPCCGRKFCDACFVESMEERNDCLWCGSAADLKRNSILVGVPITSLRPDPPRTALQNKEAEVRRRWVDLSMLHHRQVLQGCEKVLAWLQQEFHDCENGKYESSAPPEHLEPDYWNLEDIQRLIKRSKKEKREEEDLVSRLEIASLEGAERILGRKSFFWKQIVTPNDWRYNPPPVYGVWRKN
jgi:hypothetical protein